MGTYKLHLRAARAFLGLPKNVASFGLLSELNWLLPHLQTRIKMIQYFSRIMNTPSNRLLYKVYIWDRKLNETNDINTWSAEIKSILYDNNLGYVYENQQIFSTKNVIDQLKTSMYKTQQQMFITECENKPKLRTFMLFKDFETLPPHIGKPLTFIERKIISRLRLGILPIRIETARYIRPILPENERLCYCNSGQIESECHVLFSCCMYNDLRHVWLNKLCIPENFRQLSEQEKLKIVLNKPENVKQTSQYLIALMDLRSLLNKAY